jgi:hypothetical protein
VGAFAQHLFVEEHQGGAVLRVNKPGAELGSVQTEFDKVGLRSFSFFPCDTHLVLWIPGDVCRELDANVAALSKNLPAFDVVACIVYQMDTYFEDCRSGRLPRERCRQRISEVLAKERCGGVGRSAAKELAKTALALGLVNDVNGVCEPTPTAP